MFSNMIQNRFTAISLLMCFDILSPMAFAQIDRMEVLRNQMVDEYIVKEGITNRRVIAAMRKVPRHEFMLPAIKSKAYWDGAFPIGHEQTISPPFIVAYMTETIDPQPTDRVLEIGTGSGYQAAVLGELAQEVYSIEIVEPLGKAAGLRLKDLGYDNVSTKVGDGYLGWPEHAPFDKIIVTCSPEKIPVPLVEQLKEGGKMIIPLGERYQQVFHLLEKKNGRLVQQKLIPTLFVPMTGVSEENRQVQPDPLNPKLINGGFETDANADDRADNWHYQRQTKLIAENPAGGRRYMQFENEEPGRLAQALQGMAVDGKKIRSLRVSLKVKCDNVRNQGRNNQAALMVHFYDAVRKPVGDRMIGPFAGTQDWETIATTFRVPPQTQEIIVRIGLNGAIGTLGIDDVELSVSNR
jgi:protein-L-isoaspartate(D-aspartate) O-methyltransferase